MSKRARQLVKLLEKLIRQDHLYSDEQLKQMKSQLRVIKEELAILETKTSKGFGKCNRLKQKTFWNWIIVCRL